MTSAVSPPPPCSFSRLLLREYRRGRRPTARGRSSGTGAARSRAAAARARTFAAPDLPGTANAPGHEIFGREDGTEPDGSPSYSLEHIVVDATGVTAKVDAAEGSGTADAAAPLRFTGRSIDGVTPFGLTYAVTGDVLERTVSRGGATIDRERCTREPEPPVPSPCARPYTPATTLHAVEPDTPVAAWIAGVHGVVQVRVVLDDRSLPVWTEIMSSPSPLLNDVSVRAVRASKFQTTLRDCRPVASFYVFSIDYMTR